MILKLRIPVLSSFILMLFTIKHASAKLWNASSFVSSCGSSAPSDWLCDPDNYLDSSGGGVTDQLAHVNNNTNGEISWDYVYYYGYVIAAAVVDTVEQEDTEDVSASVQRFGEFVQKAWFGSRICDNSTVVLASLNTSRVLIFPGDGTDSRLRSGHREVCANLRVDASNVTEGIIKCINALDKTLQDALKPYSNAPWGYGGVVVIMTMLIFHYWIKY